MPIQNKYLVENKKPVELVQELEKYEIKKSPLSPAARGKVINKSGSGYVSENKGDYGPCTSSCCSCSSYELRRQLQQKQEDLDILWEKFKEYDNKWEDYKKVVDTYFSDIDFIRRNPVSEVRNSLPVKLVTELIPGAGLFTLKHDMSVGEGEAAAEKDIKNGCRSCYKKICDKYNQIRDWYWRIKDR